MLAFQFTDGPQVVIDDDCDEAHAVWAIGGYLNAFSPLPPGGNFNLRITQGSSGNGQA